MLGHFRHLPRHAATGLERLLQISLRSSAATWTAARTWGRQPLPIHVRGHHCRCEPGLPLHLLHSEGLRESCDFVVDFGSNVRSQRRLPWPIPKLAHAAAQLPAGATVHVKTDCLSDFVAHIFPAIRRPIVLVTGDSDRSPVRRFAQLLDHPHISHWFAQNCDRADRHPRLTRIPIGIDNPVFTKMEKRLGFALTMLLGLTPFDPSITRNDMGDQALLQRIAATLPPPSMRPRRALCTFHQNQKLITPNLSDLPARAEALQQLANNTCCHFEDRRLKQAACWRRHGEFAFEISPHGNGLDCFRTWEALFLGTIPIVKRSSLDPLYEDHNLPVVIVDSWHEVTAENLGRWHERYLPKLGVPTHRVLALDYWCALVNDAAHRARHAAG